MFKKLAYHQVPNVLVDRVLREVSPSAGVVLWAVCRLTFGWQKEEDQIAISQLIDLTGLSRSTIIKALAELVDKNVVLRTDGRLGVEGNTYRVNLAEGVQFLDRGGVEFIPLGVRELDPPKKEEKKEKESGAAPLSLFMNHVSLDALNAQRIADLLTDAEKKGVDPVLATEHAIAETIAHVGHLKVAYALSILKRIADAGRIEDQRSNPNGSSVPPAARRTGWENWTEVGNG